MPSPQSLVTFCRDLKFGENLVSATFLFSNQEADCSLVPNSFASVQVVFVGSTTMG